VTVLFLNKCPKAKCPKAKCPKAKEKLKKFESSSI
jgi:hypothetical protein